jgi:PAS domain S-box-containing protein
LLDAIPDAVVIIDETGHIVDLNVQTESLFGYSRDELLGEAVEMLIPTRFHDTHIADRTAYHKMPHVRPMGIGRELKAVRKDGRELTVEISLAPFQTPDGAQVVGTIRDVHARGTPPGTP